MLVHGHRRLPDCPNHAVVSQLIFALNRLRSTIHEIIFEAETPAGKAFDIALLVMILLSVLVVSLESIESYSLRFGRLFFYLEWGLTILFTLEYLLRIFSVRRPWGYILSFFGIVDLLSILPTFLSLFISGSQYLITIRALRLLRIFRVFKLGNYLAQSQILLSALRASRIKIVVFLGAVLASVVIIGSLMYLVEGGANSGFNSIPESIYWAIVTITTVGYGDIAPQTVVGQFTASLLMLMGYAIIAVPTGIVTSEMVKKEESNKKNQVRVLECPECLTTDHESDASYCKKCGAKIS